MNMIRVKSLCFYWYSEFQFKIFTRAEKYDGIQWKYVEFLEENV